MEHDTIFNSIYAKDDPQSIERGLKALREAGASLADCVRVVGRNLNLTLTQSDQLVLNSKAWEDHKEGTLKLRNAFFDGLEVVNDIEQYINLLAAICDKDYPADKFRQEFLALYAAHQPSLHDPTVNNLLGTFADEISTYSHENARLREKARILWRELESWLEQN